MKNNITVFRGLLMRTKQIVILILVGLMLSLCACGNPAQKFPGSERDEPAVLYQYTGTVNVEGREPAISDIGEARIFGNKQGSFTAAGYSRSASTTFNQTIEIPDLLKRYLQVNAVSKRSYSFKSFRLVTDIILKPDHFIDGECSASIDLVRWGGDPADLSQYIDLATGDFVVTNTPEKLYRTRYDSILFQINAPADTIVPDFEEDSYDKTTFSWTDVKPFFSTNSSAQHVVFSTYVKRPFVKWLGAKTDGFDSLSTILTYSQRLRNMGFQNPEQIDDFEQWAFSAPLNQEFFDELSRLSLNEDPHSGEAWVFMPMAEPIDLTTMDAVNFSFEFFIHALFNVFTDDQGNTRYMLDASKNYVDQDGQYYYAPLPIRIRYAANQDGFPVKPLPLNRTRERNRRRREG